MVRNAVPPSRFVTSASRLILAVFVLTVGCFTSSEPDPRCVIDADGRHHKKLAQTINASRLWQSYFKTIDPDASRKLVEFTFKVDRDRHNTRGGDYDPGKITIVFRAENLTKKQHLYDRDEEVDLDAFMVGFFDKNASRDEIQEIAFKATEDRVYPFLATWIDIAAIKAMGQERSGGYEFEDMLQRLLDDQWSNLEIQTACREALANIRG